MKLGLALSGGGIRGIAHAGALKALEENNIKIPEKLTASTNSQYEVKNETKKTKEDTKIITCNLYKEGKSIDEICNIRGLTRVTVENHLLKCYEAGIDVDLEKAIKLIGIEKLRPLKDALPEQVTYFDIHYYVIKYNNNDISA